MARGLCPAAWWLTWLGAPAWEASFLMVGESQAEPSLSPEVRPPPARRLKCMPRRQSPTVNAKVSHWQ